MTCGFFVTGTDTDCGKTHAAVALISTLRARGLRVSGFKPVAAGASLCDGKLQNDDALALLRASGLPLAYDDVNPYCFGPAVAPHLAAAEAGALIELTRIEAAFGRLAAVSDRVVVEGAGGWRVPLGGSLDIQALACALGLPVVLVVGLRLGCLNHALLTEQAIRASGVDLAGWIGSPVDPGMARRDANVLTLRERLEAPCLGILPYGQAHDPAMVASLTGLVSHRTGD